MHNGNRCVSTARRLRLCTRFWVIRGPIGFESPHRRGSRFFAAFRHPMRGAIGDVCRIAQPPWQSEYTLPELPYRLRLEAITQGAGI
jgi:hypothetical protein